jgi:hypothetical protein
MLIERLKPVQPFIQRYAAVWAVAWPFGGDGTATRRAASRLPIRPHGRVGARAVLVGPTSPLSGSSRRVRMTGGGVGVCRENRDLGALRTLKMQHSAEGKR